jgi:ATP-dependent Clp protease ATP-binding subunit ClpB
MTSNLGSSLIIKMADEKMDKSSIEMQIDELLHNHFKPEFLNRVDETIIFERLKREDLMAIVDIQIAKLLQRLDEKGVSLHIRESAKHFLVDNGYNPSFGARPMKRAIQRNLENPLALQILQGKIQAGDHVIVEGTGKGLTFALQKKS